MKHSFKKVIALTIVLTGAIILIPQTVLNSDKATSKKTEKPIVRKTYIPELLVDCRKGEIDPNYSFYEPLGILSDSNGNIFVLDCRNSRIIKYDKNLKHLKSIGKQGRGPGEFFITKGTGRSNLAIDDDNNVYLIDNKNFRVNIYSDDLQFLRSFQTLTHEYFSIAVDSNKDIYLSKNPSTSDKLGDLFTIHKYSKSKESYMFTKSFSKCLAWTQKNNLSFYEHIKILNLSRSIIRIGPKDEIYQIFYSLPIIRKFNKNGDILLQKIIAQQILIEEGWRESDIKNIFNLNESLDLIQAQKKFITFIDFYTNKKTKTLLLLMQKQRVLEIDDNCNPLMLLTPDDKLSNLSGPYEDEYCSNLKTGHFSFTYNAKSNQFLFLSWNSGEIWVGYN